MTGDQILHALLAGSNVYLHYTSAQGLAGIQTEGVIRGNGKFAVYLTQEPIKESDAHNTLFIGATTHQGRATHVIVLRLDSGVPVERVGYYEYCVRQNIRLDQHVVLFAGPNPF
jgi:hypothetical protein